MLTKEIIETAKVNGEETICKSLRLATVPTTKLEKAVIDLKFNSINANGEIDEHLMALSLPKGKQRRKQMLKFIMKMFPELIVDGAISPQVPTNLQFIATAIAMKKDQIRMAKWLRRHGVTEIKYNDDEVEYSYYEIY